MTTETLHRSHPLRELTKALGKLKNGKAGGSSNILPKMVKVACDDVGFRECLLDLPALYGRETSAKGMGQCHLGPHS